MNRIASVLHTADGRDIEKQEICANEIKIK